jgi:CDP-diglyceride synthetase
MTNIIAGYVQATAELSGGTLVFVIIAAIICLAAAGALFAGTPSEGHNSRKPVSPGTIIRDFVLLIFCAAIVVGAFIWLFPK